MKKLNIAFLFGGCSPEYNVSLESAYSVISSLNKDRYNPVMIGISHEGDWFYFTGKPEKIKNDTWLNKEDCMHAVLSPDRSEHKLLVFNNEHMKSITIDAAFPILHGKNGEDGTVQGMIELAGIPLAGCSILASALCMDKYRAHKLAHSAGIHIPDSIVLEHESDYEASLDFAEQTGYPLYVKPVRSGSSFGVTKVQKSDELKNAVRLAFRYDNKVIVEENIEGFEVGCAILGNNELTVGEVDEIELSNGFFDFTEKYTLKTSSIYVPARISKNKADEIKETAKVIYKALGCSGFARVDMFLTPSGEIVFNEVNTIPGFTEHSRYPGMMKAAGLSFTEIIEKIIELAVNP